jgi:hypothetical protein
MIQRRVLRTDHMKLFVLDEADEMLSVSFVSATINKNTALTLNPAWFHRANLRHLPASSSVHPGYSAVGHHAPGRPGGDHQVHA